MKKMFGVIIFTAIVVVLVAIIVFSSGNSPQQPQQTMNTSTQNASNISSISSNSTISLQELSSHDSKSDCWVGYNKSAYDITSWLPRHPGSSAAIEPYCGKAAEFESAFKGQHGTSQVKKLIAEGEYKGELR